MTVPKICLTIVRHDLWDRSWDPKNDALPLAVQEISWDSGYAGKYPATVSRHQKLTACWNYTELLWTDSQVAASWYVLFSTANCQASFLGYKKQSQKLCLTIARHNWDHQANLQNVTIHSIRDGENFQGLFVTEHMVFFL